MNYKEDSFLIRTYTKAGTGSPLQSPCLPQSCFTNTSSLDYLQPPSPARTRTGRLPRTQPSPFAETSGNYHTLFGRTVVTYCHFIQSSFTHFRKEVPLHRQTIIKIKMKHFTIFQGFYYAIAEMTEEEIVSTIGSFTYREKSKKYAASLQSKEKRLPMRRKKNCRQSPSPPATEEGVPK